MVVGYRTDGVKDNELARQVQPSAARRARNAMSSTQKLTEPAAMGLSDREADTLPFDMSRARFRWREGPFRDGTIVWKGVDGGGLSRGWCERQRACKPSTAE